MNSKVNPQPHPCPITPGSETVPEQEASLDIWDKKYRLKTKTGAILDATMDDTYQRMARALSSVEKPDEQEHWHERFLWALRRGAIPAGRIVSNAGAREHKPATSTINCTVSGTIRDSMDDILSKVHEAGLTLKAGCVAPGTWVRTERGLVTAERAVEERHARILSYDRMAGRFEMRPILAHLRVRVPRTENLEIGAGGVCLQTSIKHPVLVHREERLQYVRADEVRLGDALVQHRLDWTADAAGARMARLAGTHLAKTLLGQRGMGRVRSWARFLWPDWWAPATRTGWMHRMGFGWGGGPVLAGVATASGPAWNETGFEQKVREEPAVSQDPATAVPQGVRLEPERYFLPFLAGLSDAMGGWNPGQGRLVLRLPDPLARELQALVGWFGVPGAIRPEGEAERVRFEIEHAAFLAAVLGYSAQAPIRERFRVLAESGRGGRADQRYCLPRPLRERLETHASRLSPAECVAAGLGLEKETDWTATRAELDRWAVRFPDLAEWVDLARTLVPVETLRRDLPLPESFYDFHVADHNNYLAGRGGLVVIHNCGIGYEFSTLRPRGAYVSGAGSYTSGPLSFMDIYDRMCFTISSAGGRRGAQMATFDVSHPDVLEFIRAKREDGRLRQFNLSLLITRDFMEAVRGDAEWPLVFPFDEKEVKSGSVDLNNPDQVVWKEWPQLEGYVRNGAGLVACKIYKRIRARRLWDLIMASTYDFAEPGFVLIDKVNEMNNDWWCENIRATNPCGEQPLPPYGSCLLGSVNLTRFVRDPFTPEARFDWAEYREVVKVFTRMLDDVVEINGLPLGPQRAEIQRKRRHGMGYLGLGSALTLLGLRYGSPESVRFTEDVSREMAIAGWEEALELAQEKGPAPIMLEEFSVTEDLLRKRPEMVGDGWKVGDRITGRELHARYSRYMQRVAEVAPELVAALSKTGARFTHHTSIAPTGTISLALANNASNGIEPSFAHYYFRNVIREGKKSKEKIDVYSFELLAYRTLVNPKAAPAAERPENRLPEYFSTAEQVTPREHVDIQAAAQKWIDSSISKTANVPTNYPYDQFKDIYLYAYEQGLKGCTTFRFNPAAFQGVLVKEQDLRNTQYRFTLEDGTVIEARGDEEIEYDGEIHTAANLYDALKEGYYGRF
jgi:ribonucleoside-diphosphate reductase alpha chain